MDCFQYVTRSVRVIDLITNIDIQVFQSLSGIKILLDRLQHEVEICRLEQPFEISVDHKISGGPNTSATQDGGPVPMDTSESTSDAALAPCTSSGDSKAQIKGIFSANDQRKKKTLILLCKS